MKARHHSNGFSRCVRNTVSAIAALGAFYAGAVSAQAQVNAEHQDALEEVVVTGYRSSLEQAIKIKRDTDAEVDSILAEDIGKFPDQNLAESLQRIPGVAITREEGEGREITVRGLGPQFTRVRINVRHGSP